MPEYEVRARTRTGALPLALALLGDAGLLDAAFLLLEGVAPSFFGSLVPVDGLGRFRCDRPGVASSSFGSGEASTAGDGGREDSDESESAGGLLADRLRS